MVGCFEERLRKWLVGVLGQWGKRNALGVSAPLRAEEGGVIYHPELFPREEAVIEFYERKFMANSSYQEELDRIAYDYARDQEDAYNRWGRDLRWCHEKYTERLKDIAYEERRPPA